MNKTWASAFTTNADALIAPKQILSLLQYHRQGLQEQHSQSSYMHHSFFDR